MNLRVDFARGFRISNRNKDDRLIGYTLSRSTKMISRAIRLRLGVLYHAAGRIFVSFTITNRCVADEDCEQAPPVPSLASSPGDARRERVIAACSVTHLTAPAGRLRASRPLRPSPRMQRAVQVFDKPRELGRQPPPFLKDPDAGRVKWGVFITRLALRHKPPPPRTNPVLRAIIPIPTHVRNLPLQTRGNHRRAIGDLGLQPRSSRCRDATRPCTPGPDPGSPTSGTPSGTFPTPLRPSTHQEARPRVLPHGVQETIHEPGTRTHIDIRVRHGVVSNGSR